MKEREIEPGAVMFFLGFPLYGIVAKRENWLKWAEKETPRTAECFLKAEKKFKMIPFLVLGSFSDKKVQSWAASCRELKNDFVDDPKVLLKNLSQFLLIEKNQYLHNVHLELAAYVNYLNNLEDLSSDFFDFFHKALK
jgi:hypothetical protein